ncbi:Ku protein [Actinacidiphila sp. ITFR-21]|uniref:non-homologous end joining protein Ku n=1 Tax=Actinacidiphila sp. ITFR-21 TaxID=3075199 RepID=UPI00288A12E9|nr:Ku protein [Streptomyces sp. ITFR-21]WNI19220.1 Ku protein [Streptomyces sp. ITFR-21]
MPPIWSGTLTFGLVAIPVRMESATRSHRIAFRQVHREDQGRVRYRKVCELDEHVLMPEDIGRAYETPGGQLVSVTDDDLDQMPLPTAKTIEVSGFLDLASVRGEQFATPYFLAPAVPGANKPYVLMREALARAGKAAVGKWALRGSGEALGLVYAAGDILVAHRMRWADELRPAGDAAPPDVYLTAEEIRGALALIDAIGDTDLTAYHDEYAEAMRTVVEAKAHGEAPPSPVRPKAADTGVTDLMTALQRAAEQARADRGEDAAVHAMPKKRAGKKAAAKKTAAKKTARKRAG